MNPSTVLGMIGGVVLLVVAVFVTAKDAAVFLNLPGLMIVVGGTLAATLMSFPLRQVLHVFRVFYTVMKRERLYARKDIDEIVRVSRELARADIKGAEAKVDSIDSPFLRTGIQLIVDGTPMPDVLSLLQWRIQRLKAKERAEAKVFRTMAMYAPAFGMAGTLIGLVNMLLDLGEGNMAQIGVSMALAMITTFYGIVLANLVFKPLAVKIEERTDRRVAVLSMVLEGVAMLGEKRTPSFIRETLNSFVAHYDGEFGENTAHNGLELEDSRAPASAEAADAAHLFEEVPDGRAA